MNQMWKRGGIYDGSLLRSGSYYGKLWIRSLDPVDCSLDDRNNALTKYIDHPLIVVFLVAWWLNTRSGTIKRGGELGELEMCSGR